MGNGKAVRALLAIVTVIAACLPQPSQAAGIASAPASISTQMTINGRAFTFESQRCVNIPAMPGAVKARVEVSRQQATDAGDAACSAIRFFQDPGCSGQTLDFLPTIGTQSVKYIPGVATSALCLIDTSRPATGTAAPSNNILESASGDASESARVMLESTLGVTDPSGTAISGGSNVTIDPGTGNNTAGGPAVVDSGVPVLVPGDFSNNAVTPTKSPEPSGNNAYGTAYGTTEPSY